MAEKTSGFRDEKQASEISSHKILGQIYDMESLPRSLVERRFAIVDNFICERGTSIKIIYIFARNLTHDTMYWTLELASSLDDAPWPATKEELIDYANRSGAPEEVIENLEELEEEGEIYETIEDIWPDYPTKDDFFFNEEEY